jgi:uncharacterized protein
VNLDLAPTLALLRQEIPNLAGVYLFGSFAAGLDRADSDVDLGVFAGRPLQRPRVIELAHRVASLLRRDVDLVDLADASTILQMQAIGEGRLIDAPKPYECALFEVRVMRDYQDLKARRREIEADIVARGRVYAR